MAQAPPPAPVAPTAPSSPLPLRSISGHDAARRQLADAEDRGRAHHAYLFTGAEGVGKRRIAYALAARALCKSPISDSSFKTDACGHCRSCVRIFETPGWFDARAPFQAKDDPPDLAPRHPDLLTLVPHGRFIKIAQIREVLRITPFQPVEAPSRFVLIDDAHLMNDEAANALLKTLEEPPSRTRFILITSQPTSLLVTIRSRCQHVPFSRLSDSTLEALLQARGVDPLGVVPLAQGSLRLALDLAGDTLSAAWPPLARALLSARDQPAVHALAAQLADLGTTDALFDRMARLMRDALLLRSGVDLPLFHASLALELTAWTATQTAESLLYRLELIEDTRILSKTFSMQARLAFERLLLAITAPAGATFARPLASSRATL